MAYLSDEVFDQGLDWAVANGTQLSLCSSEPSTYGDIAAAELGTAAVTLTGPANGATDGRSVTIPAVTDVNVDTSGSLTHWALHDDSSVLVATGSVNNPQPLTAGNSFDTDAATITIRDATAV